MLRGARCAPTNPLIGHGGKHRAAGPNDGVGSNGDAGGNKAIGGDPCAVPYHDRSSLQVELGRVNIMAAGAEVAVLGDDAVPPNANGGEAIQHDPIANPAIVRDRHIPRKGNPGSGANHHIPSYLCAKKPQQEHP